MKRFLLVSLALLCCLGCKLDNAKEDLQSFLKEHEPTTQIFKVNTDSIVELVGERGTILKIDPRVLQHLDGSAVEEELEIHLLELTSTEDLLRANAQTVSNGKWLISGGAYNIQIFSDYKELKIAKGKKIEVSFPKITSEEMQLFDGIRDTDKNMNWEPSDQILKNRKYPAILQKDSSFMYFNRTYAIDMPVDTVICQVLEKKFTLENFRNEHKRIDSIFIKSDTLIGRIFDKLSRRDSLWISNDSTNNILSSRLNDLSQEVYKRIDISQLGWINIDRFYPEIKDRVEFKLKGNLEMDSEQFYAIDVESNTVLNLYGYNYIIFNAPLNKEFVFVSFATKDENIYGFKKQILIKEKGKVNVEYKKIKNDEINDYFKLD